VTDPSPTPAHTEARQRATAYESLRSQILDRLRKNAEDLDRVEQTAEGLRNVRNDLVLQGARLSPPLTAATMGGAAKVSHSYISRVIRDGGRPVSGSPPPDQAAAARLRQRPRGIGGRR
jgi:hypothetical protein